MARFPRRPRYMAWGRWFGLVVALLWPALIFGFLGGIFLCPGLMRVLLWPERTLFADDFSFEQFDKVKVGMTDKEVVALLGEPLRVEKLDGVGGTLLVYATQDPKHANSDYWYVDVHLDVDGRVVEKTRQFTTD